MREPRLVVARSSSNNWRGREQEEQKGYGETGEDEVG